MTKVFKISLPTKTGSIEVDAIESSTEGLIVHCSLDKAGFYNLTHKNSKYAIPNSFSNNIFDVLKLSENLGEIDWTFTNINHFNNNPVEKKIVNIIRNWNLSLRDIILQ